MEKGTPSRTEEEIPKSRLTKAEMDAFAGQEWTGKCKWFNVTRGFGFLVPDNNDHDVFVHQVS